MELETKDGAGDTREIKNAFGDFLRAFEAFKESNDARLAEIASQWHRAMVPPGADLTAALDAVDADLARPERGGYPAMGEGVRARIAAIVGAVQTPEVIAAYQAAQRRQ